LLSFVNFQVKTIYFDGISKSSAVISDFGISQGSVATQLRWGGRPCNSYTEFPLESVSETILKIGLRLLKLWSNVTCIVFWDTVYIC